MTEKNLTYCLYIGYKPPEDVKLQVVDAGKALGEVPIEPAKFEAFYDAENRAWIDKDGNKIRDCKFTDYWRVKNANT